MTLSVGSWPGRSARNAFVAAFLDGLAEAGCDTVGLEDVESIGRHRDIDILLLHWAERVFWESPDRRALIAKIRRFFSLLDSRSPGTRVVWLAHNIRPHDAGLTQRLIWKPFTGAFAKRVDATLTLSPGTLGPVLRAHPLLAGKPHTFVWHPAYEGAALDEAERQAARRARGWSDTDRVLGFCGFIRPYKGVRRLANAFLDTRDPHLRLLVTGQPHPRAARLVQDLEAMADADPRLSVAPGYLPDEAYREAVGCCDVIVAPFRDYLHSGSLIYALSAGRPVLTPSNAYADGLRDKLGPDWVRTYDDALDAAVLVAGAGPAPAAGPPLADFAPAAVGAKAAAWFRTLLPEQRRKDGARRGPA